MTACTVCGEPGLTGNQVCALIKRLSDVLESADRDAKQRFSSLEAQNAYRTGYLTESIRILARDIAEGTI